MLRIMFADEPSLSPAKALVIFRALKFFRTAQRMAGMSIM